MFVVRCVLLGVWLQLIGLGVFSCFFFFNDTATTEIYTLSLHDALPISKSFTRRGCESSSSASSAASIRRLPLRSEEHTSELQSRGHLVCRLLLEKKKKKNIAILGQHNQLHAIEPEHYAYRVRLCDREYI